jgi:hypothetical protein
MSMQNGFGYRMLTLNAVPKKLSRVLVKLSLATGQYCLLHEFSQNCTPVFSKPSSYPTMQSMSLSPSKSPQNGAANLFEVRMTAPSLDMSDESNSSIAPEFAKWYTLPFDVPYKQLQ